MTLATSRVAPPMHAQIHISPAFCEHRVEFYVAIVHLFKVVTPVIVMPLFPAALGGDI
jgi:hypothetical protein